MIPGICLCHAPALERGANVLYALYPNGFNAGTGVSTSDPVFLDPEGNALPGGGAAQVRARGPLGKIEFFVEGAFVGRYGGSTSSPRRITGYMANSGYMGGQADRPRRGEGRYVITSREIARRIASALYLENEIPTEGGLSASFSEFLEVADKFRGNGSEFAAWYQHLSSALRGSMNLAALAYLLFQEL